MQKQAISNPKYLPSCYRGYLCLSTAINQAAHLDSQSYMWAPAAFERTQTKKHKYYCKMILKQSLFAHDSILNNINNNNTVTIQQRRKKNTFGKQMNKIATVKCHTQIVYACLRQSGCTVLLPVWCCVSITKHHTADDWKLACVTTYSRKQEGPQRHKQILKI